MRKSPFRVASVLASLALLVAACGDQPDTEATADPGATTTASGEAQALTVFLPVDSPNMYGFRVANANGYFEEEGLDVTLEFVDGSGAAIQQMLAGNGEIASVGTANVAEAIEEGFDNIRAIGNTNYGSVFLLTVPEESEIQSPADLGGMRIGISDLAGGEVPVVRGIVSAAGFDPESDVELIPVGEGTALAVQAIDNGDVDAFGGSVNDIVAIEVQGIPLRTLDPGDLGGVPALPLVTTQEYIDASPGAVEGFLRAVARGADFGLNNTEETLEILMEQSREQFTDETGERIYELILDLWQPPDGDLFHSQSVEAWQYFFDVIAVELPEGTDLDTIIVDDYLEAANDF